MDNSLFPVTTPAGIIKEPLTRQEMVNRAYEHFVVKKNPPSIENDGNKEVCRYRNWDGNACAIGIFIPDEMYVKEMENKGSATVLFATVKPNTRSLDFLLDCVDKVCWLNFLGDIQLCHDNAAVDLNGKPFYENFASNLQAVCEYYNLTMPQATSD